MNSSFSAHIKQWVHGQRARVKHTHVIPPAGEALFPADAEACAAYEALSADEQQRVYGTMQRLDPWAMMPPGMLSASIKLHEANLQMGVSMAEATRGVQMFGEAMQLQNCRCVSVEKTEELKDGGVKVINYTYRVDL